MSAEIRALSVLVIMLAASGCKAEKECRQWRLQVEVPMGAEVTTSTRATPDRSTLEQAQWTTIAGPGQSPTTQPWAEQFPEVGYTVASPDGVVASDKPQVLTVIVADGCD
jgi:hypothetical protein